MTIILLSVLITLLVVGVAAAARDVSRIGSQALDRRRALRACTRGWDWQAFEREFATYAARGSGPRAAARRRR